MVAVKAHQAEAFLKAPGPRLSAILFYGTDAGLVIERAQKLAAHYSGRENPPGEILRLDDADLENDSDRLTIELQTIPMFGGRKIVRATAGRRVSALALKPLLQEGNLAGILIVEAGNLKPDDAMRQLFEKGDQSAAVACYGDEAGDIEGVVREALKAAGRTITADARQLLVSRLGADRVLSRGEIEKLLLFTQGQPEIGAEDVEAIVGDASELAIDRILTANFSGDAKRAISEFGRAVASGESAQSIILAAQRYVHRLHRVRAAMDQGGSLEDALRQLRPPLHFKQKDVFSAQCRAWSGPRLQLAMSEIATTAKSARLTSALDETLAERMLLRIARMAREAMEKARSR